MRNFQVHYLRVSVSGMPFSSKSTTSAFGTLTLKGDTQEMNAVLPTVSVTAMSSAGDCSTFSATHRREEHLKNAKSIHRSLLVWVMCTVINSLSCGIYYRTKCLAKHADAAFRSANVWAHRSGAVSHNLSRWANCEELNSNAYADCAVRSSISRANRHCFLFTKRRAFERGSIKLSAPMFYAFLTWRYHTISAHNESSRPRRNRVHNFLCPVCVVYHHYRTTGASFSVSVSVSFLSNDFTDYDYCTHHSSAGAFRAAHSWLCNRAISARLFLAARTLLL